MTLIAYADKTLYADDRAVLNSDTSAHVRIKIKKLNISRCSRVAFAAVGQIYDKQEIDLIMGSLLSHFETDSLGINDIPKDDILNKFIFKESGSSIIVMTSRNVYEFNAKGGIRLNREHHMSFGSGGNLFDFGYLIIKGTKTLAKIEKLYSDISYISPWSGPLADHVKMSDLKPFN